MKKTNELIKTLEEFYGNGHLGLASQVGYMSGLLKGLELEVEGVSKYVKEHTDWLKKNKKK